MNADRVITVSYNPVFHIIIDNFWGYHASHEILNHLNSIKSSFHEASVSSQNVLMRSYRTNTLCYLDSLYPRWSFLGSWQKELEEWPKRKQARASASPLLRIVDNLFEHQASRYGQEPKTDNKGQFYTWHSDRIGR